MQEIKSVIDDSNFGRKVVCTSIGWNCYCEIHHPLGVVVLSIFLLTDHFIVQDDGWLAKTIIDAEDRLPYGWHFRNGQFFRTFQIDETANVIRDVVQLLEEEVLRACVPPTLYRGAPMHPI